MEVLPKLFAEAVYGPQDELPLTRKNGSVRSRYEQVISKFHAEILDELPEEIYLNITADDINYWGREKADPYIDTNIFSFDYEGDQYIFISSKSPRYTISEILENYLAQELSVASLVNVWADEDVVVEQWSYKTGSCDPHRCWKSFQDLAHFHSFFLTFDGHLNTTNICVGRGGVCGLCDFSHVSFIDGSDGELPNDLYIKDISSLFKAWTNEDLPSTLTPEELTDDTVGWEELDMEAIDEGVFPVGLSDEYIASTTVICEEIEKYGYDEDEDEIIVEEEPDEDD